MLRIQAKVTWLRSSLPTVGATRSRHSRSVGKWMGVRMAAGVLAVRELIKVGAQSIPVHQPVGDYVGHAQTHAAVVGEFAQIAKEEALEVGSIRPGVVGTVDGPVDDLGIHAAPEIFFPISSRIRISASTGMRAIQDFTSAWFSSSRCSMTSTGTASSLAVLCQASSRMASPPRILPEWPGDGRGLGNPQAPEARARVAGHPAGRAGRHRPRGDRHVLVPGQPAGHRSLQTLDAATGASLSDRSAWRDLLPPVRLLPDTPHRFRVTAGRPLTCG